MVRRIRRTFRVALRDDEAAGIAMGIVNARMDEASLEEAAAAQRDKDMLEDVTDPSRVSNTEGAIMAKQDRYAELADKIVDLLGGKSNISFFAHCITRLRFNVKDKGLVRVDEIEKLPGAMGAQWSGDQLQVIIGQAVSDAYDAICEKYGLERQEVVEENLDEAKRSFSINAVFEAIAACITPLVAILVGAGLLKIIVLVLEQFGISATGLCTWTPTTRATVRTSALARTASSGIRRSSHRMART